MEKISIFYFIVLVSTVFFIVLLIMAEYFPGTSLNYDAPSVSFYGQGCGNKFNNQFCQ